MLLLHHRRLFELAAGVGIAPTSRALQTRAHLSMPSSEKSACGRSCTSAVYPMGLVLQTRATHLAVASHACGSWSGTWDLHPPCGFHRPECELATLSPGKWSPRRDSHPHLSDFKSEASSVGLHGENGGRRRTCSPGRFTSPISLAMSPGSLVRFTFPNWSPRKELHPDDEVRSLACCLLHHAEKYKVERRPGLAPGKNWFASSRLDGFGMRRLKEGTPGRICTGIDPV